MLWCLIWRQWLWHKAEDAQVFIGSPSEEQLRVRDGLDLCRGGRGDILDKRLRRKRERSQRKYMDVVKWDMHRVGVTVEDGGIGGDGERRSAVGVTTEEGKSLLFSMWDYSISQVWRVLFLAWVSNNEVLIRSIWALHLNSECSFCFSHCTIHVSMKTAHFSIDRRKDTTTIHASDGSFLHWNCSQWNH